MNIEGDRVRLVGVTFVWPYSGKSVLVTGSFFNWRNTITLHSFENETQHDYGGMERGDVVGVFSTVLYLPPGSYTYKFVVDGSWCYDPKQPVVADEIGNLNNLLVVGPLPAIAPPVFLG